MKEKILARKGILIGVVVIIALLTAAFCYGGNVPDSAHAADGLGQAMEQVAVTVAQETEEQKATLEEQEAEKPAEETVEAAETAETQTEETVNGMKINPETGKDQYQTDPVPAGKPAPVEPEESTVTETRHTCTISVSCATALNHLDVLDSAIAELLPADGWILKETQVTFQEGESVYDVLQRVLKDQGIQMEASFVPIYNSAYIEGIQNLYEFDCGELSGWMYSVNGWFPNYGCSRYQVQAGDVIKFQYTCDLGADIGGRNVLD